MQRLPAILALLLIGGCAGLRPWWQPKNPATQPSVQAQPETQPIAEPPIASSPAPTKPATVERREPQRIVKAVDPPAFSRPVVNLAIYQFQVPAGTVSRSPDLWKRIDENVIELGTRDIIQKNGLRAGVAPMADFEAFMRVLDRGPIQTKPVTFVAFGVKTIELPMRRAIDEQIISYFDAGNIHAARTFEDCDNLFVIEFQPAPRKSGDVRLGVCPMVRGLRKRMVAVGDIDTREIEIRQDEKFFDMNFRIDLPLQSFLILAPSPEAKAPMSVGNAFLIQDANIEKVETIILILPQVARRPEKPAPDSSPE